MNKVIENILLVCKTVLLNYMLAAWRSATGLSVASPASTHSRPLSGFPLLSLAGVPNAIPSPWRVSTKHVNRQATTHGLCVERRVEASQHTSFLFAGNHVLNRFMLLVLLILPTTLFSQALDDYLKIASENNPGLQATYAEYEVAMQRIPQMSSLPDPTLLGSYGIPFKKMDMPLIRGNVTLMQMFPWFGTLKAQKDVAALNAEASFNAFMNSRNELYYNVKFAYYPLVELAELIHLQKDNLAVLQTYKSLATANFRNNKGSMVDVLRTDIMINDAETEIKILQQKQNPLRISFNKLLNREDTVQVILPPEIQLPNLSTDSKTDSLLNRNPKLEELQLKYTSAVSQEKVAIKSGLPQFTTGLAYQRMVNLERNVGMGMVMPMVGLSLPIYRKKYNAAVKESQLMQTSYKQMKLETENRLHSEYAMAQFELQKSEDMIALYAKQVEQASTAIRLLRSAYGNDEADMEDILKMQQEVLKYKMALATAKKEVVIADSYIHYLIAK